METFDVVIGYNFFDVLFEFWHCEIHSSDPFPFQDLIAAVMKDREPDLSLRSQTIAYLEVDPSEAERLTSMPTMVTGYNWGPIDGTYILPPILYPDGKYYLKVRTSSPIFQPEYILYETTFF
jgi:hypothetical protein